MNSISLNWLFPGWVCWLLIRNFYLFSCKWSRGESNSNHHTTKHLVQTSLYSSLRRFFPRVPLGKKEQYNIPYKLFFDLLSSDELNRSCMKSCQKYKQLDVPSVICSVIYAFGLMLESVLAFSKIKEAEWGSVWPHPSSLITLIMSPSPEHTDRRQWFRLQSSYKMVKMTIHTDTNTRIHGIHGENLKKEEEKLRDWKDFQYIQIKHVQ